MDGCRVYDGQVRAIRVWDDRLIINNKVHGAGSSGPGAGLETVGFHSRISSNLVSRSGQTNCLLGGGSNTVHANSATAPGPGGLNYFNFGFNDISTITTATDSTNVHDNIST